MNQTKYNVFPIEVTASCDIPVQLGCNGWVAINYGRDVVKVEQIPLNPALAVGATGDSVSVGGNITEVYNRNTITVTFLTTTAPRLVLIQKVYTSDTFNH